MIVSGRQRWMAGDKPPPCEYLLILVLLLACTRAGPTRDVALEPGPPGSWDSGMIHAPSVVQTDNGYLMYYDGTAGKDPYEGWGIGVATSPDSLRWEKFSGNPVLSGSTYHDPCVLRIRDTYLMWYSSLRDGRWYIERARSSEGLRWEREGTALGPGKAGDWDETGVAYSSVRPDENRYRMWYQGRDNAGRWRIGHATSVDGMHWYKDPANPVLDVGPHGAWDSERVFTPAVVRDGSGWRMVYSGSPGWGLGYATSEDGTRWRKVLGNPVLTGPQMMTPALLGNRVWYAVNRSGGQTAIESRQAPR